MNGGTWCLVVAVMLVGVDARWLRLLANSTDRATLNTAQLTTRVRFGF